MFKNFRPIFKVNHAQLARLFGHTVYSSAAEGLVELLAEDDLKRRATFPHFFFLFISPTPPPPHTILHTILYPYLTY